MPAAGSIGSKAGDLAPSPGPALTLTSCAVAANGSSVSGSSGSGSAPSGLMVALGLVGPPIDDFDSDTSPQQIISPAGQTPSSS